MNHHNIIMERCLQWMMKIILGGGITKDEIPLINELGIKKALVGTALHKGEITINDF